MNPFIIGIGGAYSGVGKTTFASLILSRLKGWGAIKYTKTSIYCSVTDDITILSEEGKDTKRLLDSGAGKVLWIRSPYENLEEILPMAIEHLSYIKGIVIEGNCALEVLKPDIVIFLSGTEEDKIKKSSEKILAMADVVIYDKEPPRGLPERAKSFVWDNVEECIDYIIGLTKEADKEGKS